MLTVYMVVVGTFVLMEIANSIFLVKCVNSILARQKESGSFKIDFCLG